MPTQFKTINVEIQQADLKVFKEQPVLRGTHIMGVLADAGVPVSGVLWPSSVEHGTLFIRITKDVIALKWEGHLEVAAPAAQPKQKETDDEPLY